MQIQRGILHSRSITFVASLIIIFLTMVFSRVFVRFVERIATCKYCSLSSVSDVSFFFYQCTSVLVFLMLFVTFSVSMAHRVFIHLSVFIRPSLTIECHD